MTRITERELCKLMSDQIAEAGGWRKWLRQHKMRSDFYKHVSHMVADGQLATKQEFLAALGYRRIVLYEKIE